MNKTPAGNIKHPSAMAGDSIYHRAFNAAQATLISTAGTGKIIAANKAADDLLGYSNKNLLTRTWASIFILKDSRLWKMGTHPANENRFTAVATILKKNGQRFPAEITSAFFADVNGKGRMITTINDLSRYIEQQKQADTKKEKIIAGNITLAKSAQAIVDKKNAKKVLLNIKQALAKSDARLEQEMRYREEERLDAAAEARETTRTDIGKELHDNVNQLLGASNLYIDLAKKGGRDTELFLTRSSEYTLTAIQEIRKLTKHLTSGIIINAGLCKAIKTICRDTMEINPVRITCMLRTFKEKTVSEKLKHALFRIIQEQLNNIIKHAKAGTVVITLSQTKEFITLVIADDGVGFNTNKKSKGIGIQNIKSRAALNQGRVDFISQPGEGCILTARFPWEEVTEKE